MMDAIAAVWQRIYERRQAETLHPEPMSHHYLCIGCPLHGDAPHLMPVNPAHDRLFPKGCDEQECPKREVSVVAADPFFTSPEAQEFKRKWAELRPKED